MQPVPVAPSVERPKWKQAEMLRAEEYPTGQGTERYMPSRRASDLTPDEVRTIRRLVKLKQDAGTLARGYRISSADCRNVASLLDRAEVPSDFESPGQQRKREIQHEDNLRRESIQAELRLGEGSVIHRLMVGRNRTACFRGTDKLKTSSSATEVTCHVCRRTGEG